MNDAATLLRTARNRAGFSVRALAALADVSPTTITQIEKGRADPGIGTLTKLLRAAGFELGTSLRRRSASPAVTLADLARRHQGKQPDWTALRGAMDWLRQHPEDLPAALRPRPKRTGSPLVDALFAGMAEKLADDAHLIRPLWTRSVPGLRERWAPLGTPRMIERWEAATPVQLRNRNIVIDEESIWRPERLRG